MRKLNPRKHELKRQEILDAAETCFVRKGFQGASIAEICAAASISAGHLYHYFASKEDIVRELAELRLNAAMAAMEHILSDPDPFGAFLRQFCQLSPATDGTTGWLVFELLVEAVRNPAIGAMVRKQGARARTLLSAMIKSGQSDRKIDPTLDPELAASILIAVVIDGMKGLLIREPDLPCDEACAMIHLLVTRFLMPQGTA